MRVNCYFQEFCKETYGANLIGKEQYKFKYKMGKNAHMIARE